MTMDLILFVSFFAVLVAAAIPLGKYLAGIFSGEKTASDRIFSPVENIIYRLGGVDSKSQMNWKSYAASLISFNIFGLLFVFIIQMAQGVLPLNPQNLGGVPSWHLALNTAVSFMTNTNWQAYSGESTMSYFTQMTALTVQNFLSAATGLAVAVALIRGITRHSTSEIGNFWSDLVRGTIRVLIPLAVIISIILIQQGTIQNMSPYKEVVTLEGVKQVLPMGPAASQIAIKMLGTNGGGFFNANSAHPFENPTPVANFIQMLSILLIPTALTLAYGHMSGERRQGYVILAAMLIMIVAFLGINYTSEISGNPHIAALGVSGPSGMEGKEMRFGISDSSLFSTVTTAASCGAVNSALDSFTPLGGLVPMVQIMLGEIVFGGVGAGLYGIMMYVIMTVFIVGLMVGRTPEYLGKKINAYEMKMATLAILIPSVTILIFTAIASFTPFGVTSILNKGPHGLSEIMYAFTSAAGNNGSAFGGLTSNTPFFNIGLSVAMLMGRFGVIVPVLAIAGSLAEKKVSPAGPGTFSTTSSLFVFLLVGVILLLGALTFFPALSLGPVVEHLLMNQGVTF